MTCYCLDRPACDRPLARPSILRCWMRSFLGLGHLLRALPEKGRATLDGLVEQIKTVFAGDRATRRSVAFSVAMIALSAKMAKADGIVRPEEVAAFQQIFSVPEAEMANVFRLYNLAKQDTAGFEAYAARLAAFCRESEEDCTLLADVLDGLFHIAKADGWVHERELAFLADIAATFGFSEAEFERVKLRHVAGPAGAPYAVLGIDPQASLAEVRARYIELVRENHPDRLVARGVPDEFQAIATERMKAINTAYEAVTKARAA